MNTIPMGVASTMILVSLCGAKYSIAVAAESLALTLLNEATCYCFHFQVESLGVSLRSRSVVVLSHAEERAEFCWIALFRSILKRFDFLGIGDETVC